MKREDTIEMENQISSMLEKVLKEDSEEENRLKKEDIKRKVKKSNTLLNEYGQDSHDHFLKKFELPQLNQIRAPKLLINSQPYVKDNYNNYNQFENDMRNSPLIQRKEIRYKSLNLNKTSNLNYQNPKINLLNVGSQFNSSRRMNGSSNSNSSNSSYLQNQMMNENIHINAANLFNLNNTNNLTTNPQNEFDDILERFVRPIERLNEECYEIMKGNFFKILISQNGSRVLQKVIHNTSKDILSYIFNEIEEKIGYLMTDSYANYFCQKFFGLINQEERKRFIYQLKENIVNIGNNKVGTYPLQAIIDMLRNDEEKILFIDAVRDKVIPLCYDAQGTHVIEKILVVFQEEMIREIYRNILNDFINLSTNVNGLCVIKKTILHAQFIETLNIINILLTENSLLLVQNPFGNYALQMAFENWSFDFCFPIIEKFFGQFYQLSLQKYSSNVIEKCFEMNEEIIVTTFINEICIDTRISDLMRNSYGNYVVQKALKSSTGINKFKLTTCIKVNLERLSDKKLVNKWKSIVNNSVHLNFMNNGEMNNMNLSGYKLNSSNSSIDSSRSNNSRSGHSQNINLSPCYSPNIHMRNNFKQSNSFNTSPINRNYYQNNQNNSLNYNINTGNYSQNNLGVFDSNLMNVNNFKLDGKNLNLNQY